MKSHSKQYNYVYRKAMRPIPCTILRSYEHVEPFFCIADADTPTDGPPATAYPYSTQKGGQSPPLSGWERERTSATHSAHAKTSKGKFSVALALAVSASCCLRLRFGARTQARWFACEFTHGAAVNIASIHYVEQTPSANNLCVLISWHSVECAEHAVCFASFIQRATRSPPHRHRMPRIRILSSSLWPDGFARSHAISRQPHSARRERRMRYYCG